MNPKLISSILYPSRSLRLTLGSSLLAVLSLAALPARASGPDLAITRTGSTAVYGNSPSLVTLTVTNRGDAPAPSVNLTYTPAQPSLSLVTPGYNVSSWLKGHSGRGGGYTRVGWIITQTPAVPLAAGKSTVIKFNVIYPLGTINESWTVNAGTAAQLNLVSHVAGASVVSTVPPIPSAPTGVNVTETAAGDSLLVTWLPPSVGTNAITGSKVTATPVSGVGTTVLYGTAGALATSASVVGIAPATTYSVTVQSTDLGGTGPASTPLTFTTHASHTPPGIPVGVHDWWIGSSLAVAWTPPTPGDSPIDDYQVSIKGTNTPVIISDSGTGTEDVVPVDSSQDSFVISVRAHNAAGWGNWSPAITQGGL